MGTLGKIGAFDGLRARGTLAGLCVLLLWASLGKAADAPVACTPAIARVVSLQGTIEVLRSGAAAWQRVVRLNTAVCAGDQLRSGLLSRAAVYISPETLVRLDQNTTLAILSQTDKETVVEFKQDQATRSRALRTQSCGTGYFITRFPRMFRVRTPFYNAAVEGTEFQVALQCDRGELAVFEGKVAAEDLLAPAERILLEAGQATTVADGERPSAIRTMVKPADAVQWALYYLPANDATTLDESVLAEECDALPAELRGACRIRRAEYLLRVGRVDAARPELDAVAQSDPAIGEALALKAIVAVVQNDRRQALDYATQATAVAPESSRAWAALSYARQAGFRLDDALSAAKRSAELAPQSALQRARVAELLLSLGYIRTAEKEAQAAVALNAKESRAHSILGFSHLAQIDTQAAQRDFNTAIELDSTEPLSRLGLGLALIREGKLTEGREQIEVAVALDPTNSLVRSYVGKAYYEENSKQRDDLAASQFGLGKQLDPNDPTPWFYGAILEQTQNRPVDALADLQKSIELNDNRAVYRSRLQLDQDQASRGASLARIYQDLGFEQLALVEAYGSIGRDPGNPAAHRFLSDAYVNLPRHQIAQTSELLQSALRQPLSLDPIPPQRSEARLAIPRGSGPVSPSLYELNPLFSSRGMALSLDALAGEMGTGGAQATFALLGDKAAARAGIFHYDTNGFRENNDLTRTIANAFFQVAPRSDFSAQLEFRSSEFTSGDRPLRFDPTFVLPLRHDEQEHSIRAGARYIATPNVDFIVSGIYQRGLNRADIDPTLPPLTQDLDSTLLEAQSLIHFAKTNLVVGAGRLDGTLVETFFAPNPQQKREQENGYAYASIGVNSLVRSIQVGLSMDRFADPAINRSETNPKLGIVLTPFPGTTVRAAYIRSLTRILPTGQTIEPTQVAGFNQFFNDPEGTIASRVGIGLDQQISRSAFAGIEASKRDLNVSLVDFALGTSREVQWKESGARGYIYWAAHRQLTLSAEAYYERFQRPATDGGEEQLVDLQSWRVPLGATVFLGSSWSARAAWTFWRQQGTFLALSGDTFSGREDFSVVDVQLAYRLPYRRGFIVIGANNLFDAQHLYQESDLATPRYIPQRFAYVRVSLAF